MTVAMIPEVCPVCGGAVIATAVRIEPVRNPDTHRDHGWAREIKTYRHGPAARWRECRVPVGPVFERWR
jgi:hypothetical protein